MAENKKLSDLVHVGSRFGRSVNLERDFFEDVPLNGYVLTTTARSTLHRIGESLIDNASTRAWTLTGPYGSGKSAFALFAARTLSADLRKDAQQARALVKEQDDALWTKLFGRGKTSILKRGLCPVLISGSREPIGKALLRGLVKSVKHFGPENQSFMLVEAEALLKASDDGEIIPGRRIAEVFEQVAYEVSQSRKHGNGLLVIVDELGKLLEYAAAHPYESDIFILQELAETALRSKDNPILLVTILHQTFDHYVERLDRSQKEEWMKVQGRFEDAAFQEPTDQLLRILANAISIREAEQDTEPLKQQGRELSIKAGELGIVPGALNAEEGLALLERCVPLHPTVALILGQVFRRLGQNERSLFAFLASGEPYGFQEFLNNNVSDASGVATLRLDHLYDYIVTALGSGLYVQSSGKKWAEIESALNRLANPSSLQVRLIKTIGLLRTIGDLCNIKPSREFLKFALADNQNAPEDVELALEQLQNRSIIIYRHHSDGFSLWEGSDVDIEDRLAEARAHVDPNESLASSMAKHFKPRPMIARHHSFRTGTLRFFEVRYTDRFGFEDALNEPLADADGLILYAVTFSNDEIAALTKKARASEMLDSPQTLIGIPLQTAGLREAVLEVACLRWVQENTPELEGDRTARRELDARLAQAEESVEKLLQSFLDSHAENSDRGGCAWYYKGERIEIQSERALQEFITGICDEVFADTPVLHNELINRRHVSTSAAAARRELIESMLEHGDKESLGIEGFPPQLSLYYSLLQETGIHREENGQWGFFPPKQEADSGTKAVWKAIDDFFTETESGRLLVSELFDHLKEPPFGMKSGPLPVLFCAALLHYDTEMAFYENGSFVPSLSAAVSERLMGSFGYFRSPDNDCLGWI